MELVFDNGEGKAPGEFAKYPEISIKRQGHPGWPVELYPHARAAAARTPTCFSALASVPAVTPSSSRATISRLIEAKPGELLELIEERRRISRLQGAPPRDRAAHGPHAGESRPPADLREEVSKQLESLKRQAKKAEKFTALRDAERAYREQPGPALAQVRRTAPVPPRLLARARNPAGLAGEDHTEPNTGDNSARSRTCCGKR